MTVPASLPVYVINGTVVVADNAKISGDAPNAEDVNAANVVFTISIVD